MTQFVGLGLGAGFVAALLFASVAAGSPLGMLLSYVAPLPVLIAALGWHHLVGLLAAAVGALALSLGLRPSAAVAFALGPALPAWALAYLALTGVPSRQGPDRFPVGRMLFWTGVAGAFVALAAAVGLGGGDHEQFRDTLRRATESLLRIESRTGGGSTSSTVAGVPASSFTSLLVAIAPTVAAAVFSVALALNLWAGAKVVSFSGRLPQPWPSIPDARMGAHALGLFGAAILLAFFGPGFIGVAGGALAGGLGMMFALQGLALCHLVTRGRTARAALLTLAYILAIFFGGTFLPLLALAGLIDTATPLRHRLVRPDPRIRRGGPPSPPTTSI